ncbi:MAG: CBS domain-containing protein [Alphaproteobacteria bacterium]|uniref:CBS domain-containing protein n=1 Tax=Candidatus Nitrobium versatile TaxID=2884831 RepID=A0A953M2B4_9BACT|nr:CBS domain-containing protein [Candidatus Nitrobium versatile]
MAIKVRDILKDKGLEVIAIDSGATVDFAVKKMVERNIGALLIMEEGNFVGMFTERDVLKTWTSRGPFDQVPVREVMSRDILVISPDDTLEYVMTVMTNKQIRHMPVIDSGRMVGVVSIRDVVKYHIGNLEAEVRYLTDYMFGPAA